jgi:RNA polymerase sigma-70 factor (ECF subfamily)
MLAEPCLSYHDDQESTTAVGLTDETLLRVFDEARGEIFGKLYRMLGNYQDTQDALQIAFLHCWRARERLTELHNVKAWIWRVALNAGRDLRDLVWRRRAKPLSLVETSSHSYLTSPMQGLMDEECQERLHAALPHLRPEERDVFLLRQKQSLTYEEIGRERKIPVGTAKTLMRKAVTKLRRALHEENTEVAERKQRTHGRVALSCN